MWRFMGIFTLKNPEKTMKTKNLYIFLAIVLSVFSASAQQAKKVYFGGNLGFSFGSETSVMVEPTVLYGFSQYFKLGGGVSYRYVSSDRYDYSDNIYGARAIAMATPLPYINISVDYGMYHRTTRISSGEKIRDGWIPSLSPAIGVNIPVGRGFVSIGAGYDVLYDASTSVYSNAWIPMVSLYF